MVIQKLEEDAYNLEGYSSSLTEVKREQTDESHWCEKNQFKTNYVLLKIYNIGGRTIKLRNFLRYRYENKDKNNVQGENKGEDLRLYLQNKYKNKFVN